MKTRELYDFDLDSIWTPVVNVSEFGLHPDSTSIWIPPGFRSQ